MDPIHAVNLAGIDLNLLVVLDALMTERHVTRAGERIGLSQPATSNALARLRRLTQDDLFVRTRAGLQPTPGAIALAQQIQPALKQIQAALSPDPTFDPRSSDRIFALGMTDYVEFVILPRLLETLETQAPQVQIQVRSGDRQRLLALLDNGEVDLICGVFPEQVAWHEEQLLFQETYVCVCRRDHPHIGDALSLEQYLAAAHLLVSVREDRVGRVDQLLAAQHLSRHVALSLPHFLVAPFILARTHLVATLAQRVAHEFAAAQNLKILPCPLPLEGFSVFMRSHQSTRTNLTNQWLKNTLLAVATAQTAAPTSP